MCSMINVDHDNEIIIHKREKFKNFTKKAKAAVNGSLHLANQITSFCGS
jgi:hypothetical protein